MIDAKIADIIIHDGARRIASELVLQLETIEDRRLLINAISVVAERVGDALVEEIHETMDLTNLQTID